MNGNGYQFLYILFYYSLLSVLAQFFVTPLLSSSNSTYFEFSNEKKIQYREKVISMFYHAYNGYLEYAYPKDELKPLSCKGQDTWGSYSLTLVDSLDMLLMLGNETEFERAAELVLEHLSVDKNINISVFETNIRIIGGLLSAHMLSSHAIEMTLPDGWPCSGPLLDLAEKFAQRLLPAFNTNTGMPYGTVNLKYGVNFLETPITCTAGIGTFILEFGTLSRLTGNPLYERVALRALDALWNSRSKLGLVGNHIDVQTGIFTATDAGIGAGVDSYFEYLAKGALLFQRPNLMHQFNEFEEAINQHVRRDDWFMWVDKDKATVSMPVFQSLEAFWPGLLTLVGRVEDAARIMASYGQILRHLGLPPEFYHLPNREPMRGRTAYPLRPEIPESLLYIYRATKDPIYLNMAAGIVDCIDSIAKTKCGYATVHDVTTGSLEDRMESFFLAETAKYLYLIFDEQNFMHNVGSTHAKLVETTGGSCVIEAGGWIFNTEAHPLDPGIIYCCSKKRQQDMAMLQQFEDNIDFLKLMSGNFQDLEQNEDEKIVTNHIDDTEDLENTQPINNAKERMESNSDSLKSFYDGQMANLTESMPNLLRNVEIKIEEMYEDHLVCKDCCTQADNPSLDPKTRSFWRAIYKNYFNFPSIQGTHCLLHHEEGEGTQTNGAKYLNDPPELALLALEMQNLDSIKKYSLHKSTWIRYEKRDNGYTEDFTLLSTLNRPFNRNFMGLGQIVTRRPKN